MKSKIITVALLAGLSAGAQAGDIEKVLGGVLLGVAISNQIGERHYGPPPQVQVYSEPVYAPPQVVYAPPQVVYAPPQVVYGVPPAYSYEYRHDHGYHRGHHQWRHDWRD